MKIRSNLEQQGKFRNYSEIFANIAKFSLCTKILLHSEISLCSEIMYGLSLGKDKIVHSVFILFYFYFCNYYFMFFKKKKFFLKFFYY